MKKFYFLSLFTFLLLFAGCRKESEVIFGEVNNLTEDVFVSKTPSKKKVVLEEYTATGCSNCPHAHLLANYLKNDYLGRFFIIALHGSSMASHNPDYTTSFFDLLYQQTEYGGAIPTGTINRRKFPDQEIMGLNRGLWSNYTTVVLAEDAYVNIAATSAINKTTRELKVKVQLYYTGSSPVTTNRLNVALLQDNIIGPQLGTNLNPDYIVGDQYKHMHMLRHLVTGQWGDMITNTTKGTLVTKEYNYIIPEHYMSIGCVLEDLSVIVYLAEEKDNIINGAESTLTFH